MYFFHIIAIYLSILGYVGSGLFVAQTVESAWQFRRHRFSPWVGKILWSRKWKPAPVFLSGESMDRGAWQGLQSMGLWGVDTAEQLMLPLWRWVSAAARTSSSCVEWRPLSGCGMQASHCGGFSVAERGPSGALASVLVARGLSSCSAWA